MTQKSALLNSYSEAQVAFWIDGYFSIDKGDPSRKTVDLAFEAARNYAVSAMQRHIDDLNSMPLERWQQLTELPSGKPDSVA